MTGNQTLRYFVLNGPFQGRGRDVRLNLPATGLAAHARDFHQGTELEEDRGNVAVDRERVILNLNMPPSKLYQVDEGYVETGHLPAQYSKVQLSAETQVMNALAQILLLNDDAFFIKHTPINTDLTCFTAV